MRSKIDAQAIVLKLRRHIANPEKTPMPASAITAALGLLRKVMPDLSATELSGSIESNRDVLTDVEIIARLTALNTRSVEVPTAEPSTEAPEAEPAALH